MRAQLDSTGVITFRIRPLMISAMHLLISNAEDVALWSGGSLSHDLSGMPSIELKSSQRGMSAAHAGDWVVRDIQGDFYAVSEKDFHVYYERYEK